MFEDFLPLVDSTIPGWESLESLMLRAQYDATMDPLNLSAASLELPSSSLQLPVEDQLFYQGNIDIPRCDQWGANTDSRGDPCEIPFDVDDWLAAEQVEDTMAGLLAGLSSDAQKDEQMTQIDGFGSSFDFSQGLGSGQPHSSLNRIEGALWRSFSPPLEDEQLSYHGKNMVQMDDGYGSSDFSEGPGGGQPHNSLNRIEGALWRSFSPPLEGEQLSYRQHFADNQVAILERIWSPLETDTESGSEDSIMALSDSQEELWLPEHHEQMRPAGLLQGQLLLLDAHPDHEAPLPQEERREDENGRPPYGAQPCIAAVEPIARRPRARAKHGDDENGEWRSCGEKVLANSHIRRFYKCLFAPKAKGGCPAKKDVDHTANPDQTANLAVVLKVGYRGSHNHPLDM